VAPRAARSNISAARSPGAEWAWSSARAHLAGRDDGMVTTAPLLNRVADFAGFHEAAEDAIAVKAIRLSRSTGRPFGAEDWIRGLEAPTERTPASG
jgi:putative transposase